MNLLTETFSTATRVAVRELNARFRSPVALVFLGVFLVAVNLDFFTLSGFFARGLADLRPLFSSLPLLLLVLVAALTMGGWAEERKLGTLEVLLTLPVRPWGLVLGKWLAGVALVALALALTWPLPFLVGLFGPLDYGPVIGGYLGALLVGATWVAIGLCVSSRTDNQVVALIVSLVIGGVLLLVGDPLFTGLFGGEIADALRSVGAGSRFESIERGVIDLRDLAYYASITLAALGMNVAFLELPRIDHRTALPRAAARWGQAGLLAMNGALLLLWLSPLPGMRLDLTADRAYSLAPITKQTLRTLEEPLYIDAYLSGRTHPLLAPLVPRIRDTLSEVAMISGGRVHVTVADPATDDDLAAQIGEDYGIQSVPFGVSDRHSQSVVNAYFHVVVRYGDQHEILGLENLVEIDASSTGTDIDVRLGDLEYLFMRTIRKISRSFQSLDAQLARLPEGTTATLYATPDSAPSEFQEGIQHFRNLVGELAERSNGRLTFQEVAPSGGQVDELYRELGLRPLAADIFGQQVFYAHLVIRSGDKVQRLMTGADASEGDVRRSVEAAIRRASPGQLVRVGLLTEDPEAPPPNPNLPPQFQPPPPQPDYQSLQRLLLESYDVERVELDDGAVPDHLDVLLLAKTGTLSPEQQWAIDQYLMRGGAVIALASAYGVEVQGGISSVLLDQSLRDLVQAWGVGVSETLVLDPQNAAFPMPVREQRGGFMMERVQLLPYPFFGDIRGKGLASHPALAGISNLTTPWASPLQLAEDLPDEVEATVLVRSSEQSWLQHTGEITPDFSRWPNDGFGRPAQEQPDAFPLAAALVGPMPSAFADRPSPVWEADAEGDPAGRTLTSAASDARLAVIGTSELVSDLLLRMADGVSGEVHRGNVQFLLNLLDWAVEDTDLLAIRSAGVFSRTLPRMDEAFQTSWELAAYAGALLPLLAIGTLPWLLRRRLPPELQELRRRASRKEA
ncbi:MAG: ABC transporter permease [Deltaproteobacteria bacterium]|nr:MAG: ABC transporter permease [Deltaproteobacteria bacterium]